MGAGRGRTALQRFLGALALLLLLAVAWGALAGAVRNAPRSRSLGQQVETGVQLVCGALSLLGAATGVAWRRWRAPVLAAWAVSLATAAGLSGLVWGPPMPSVAAGFAVGALLVAFAVVRALIAGFPADTVAGAREGSEAGAASATASAWRILRSAVAVAVLPVTVLVLVPVWIASRNGVVARLGASPAEVVLQAAGAPVLALGLFLFAASLSRFAGEGKGTLAPWDPPRRLVVRGPYRYVRNPMISGVLLALAGEALLLVSWPHAAWAALFFGFNATYIPLLEEPGLRRRFGDAYRAYCAHVPRLFPRRTPWSPDGAAD